MTEPTQEQIGQENAAAVFVLSTVPIEPGPDYWKLHNRIATALARLRLEAEAKGRDDALGRSLAAARSVERTALAYGASDVAWGALDVGAAIRALRGAR